MCVYSPTHHGHFEKQFNATRTRTNPIYSGGLIINFESMNLELFSNREIRHVPYMGIQASLRFWIPCCWFRIPGIGFLIFGKWNLDSGFQSLVGPGFLEQYSIFQSPGFQIPRAKKVPDSGIWIPLYGANCDLYCFLQVFCHFLCQTPLTRQKAVKVSAVNHVTLPAKQKAMP